MILTVKIFSKINLMTCVLFSPKVSTKSGYQPLKKFHFLAEFQTEGTTYLLPNLETIFNIFTSVIILFEHNN